MKYSVTMNKTEITKIVTTVNTIIGSLSKLCDDPDAKKVLNMIGGTEALKNNIEEIEKMFKKHKNGGIDNDHYSVEVNFNGDDVTTTVIISDELIVECMNIFTKIFISSYHYISAFFKKHGKELNKLVDLVCDTAYDEVADDINHMINRFNFANLLNSAWGCFVPKQDEKGKREDTSSSDIPSADVINAMANAISMGTSESAPAKTKKRDKKHVKMSKEELHELLCDEVKESLGE